MKAVLGFMFIAIAGPVMADSVADQQAEALEQSWQRPSSTNRHPDAQWFPDAGLGLFIHWGLASVGATGDLSWGMLANKPWKDRTVTPDTYYAWAADWMPDQVNYDRQLSLAKAAGFTYAVMVTKHHDGFTLWPSSHGDLGTKQHLGGRDFVREFIDACRKHGLKVGLYCSPPDWWFDRNYKSFAFRGPALGMNHEPRKLPAKPADHDARRKELVVGQVTELLSNYGRIDLLWFDGGKGEISNDEVRRLQPGIVINRRNGGGGDYGDSEGKLPDRRFKGWFETCETCWPAGKWSYTEEYGWDSATEVLEKLVRLRAWGGNLLANVGPKGDGSLPPQAVEAWSEMAIWMKHSGESVIGAGPGPFPDGVNVPVTTRPDLAYLHFLPSHQGPAFWPGVRKPLKAILLRTGESVPFHFDEKGLQVELAAEVRTGSVDVVKLVFSTP